MKKYCFDTSGISNPLEAMPEDIHPKLWEWVKGYLSSGNVGITTEIFDEMVNIFGSIGECVKDHKAELVLEIGEDGWDWKSYKDNLDELITRHKNFISEYCGGSKKTIGLVDVSIIALAKTLGLPVVSMEVEVQASTTKRRIPDVCKIESIEHLTFNEFLRREKFSG